MNVLERLTEWVTGRAEQKRAELTAVKMVTEERLSEMFLHAPDSPLWKATLAVLDQEVQEGLEDCLEEKLSSEVLRHRLGKVAGCLELKHVLLEREREARQKASERVSESVSE